MARPPIAGQEFESLTLALAEWFDKNLDDLPITLRQRVEQDFSPLPWDDLSADQRRTVTLQWDYQHDPATEQDRQFWWDFFVRMDEIKAKIAEWKSAATPTASDIALKESRLNELQQKIDRMELQQRQARGDYSPGRTSLAADKVSNSADYIAYPKAMKILRERLKATPEELAAWIFLGPETGGIAAYRNANELNPPPRFYIAYFTGVEDYLSPLMACWFRQDDIDRFEPADRYITGTELIERWSKQPGLRPEAFIRAKIAESRLPDMHPTFGGTQGTFDDDASFPPLSSGLFAMSHITQIEAEDSLDSDPVLSNSDAKPVLGGEKGGRPKSPLSESVEIVYLHFRDKGDAAILHAGNIRAFMKSFASLAKDDILPKDLGKRNITNAICERIKEVKIPREGKCFVTTHDRTDGKKILPGRRYGQEVIATLLTDLRKKYPLPS